MASGLLAVALGGGGARSAGVLRRIGRAYAELRPAILVGESAGAINAAYLAAHLGMLLRGHRRSSAWRATGSSATPCAS